jgi:LysM repeat protein
VTVANPQTILLVSQQPPITVRGLRGNTPPTPAAGTGGWQLVPRPRRKSLTQWKGIDPFQQQFSLIFDGLANDQSVEPSCLALEQMARPPAEQTPPPIVRVVGVVPHPELDYVIGDGNGGPGLAWGDVLYSPSGYRIRQEVTVTLLEYVADDRVASVPAAARARQQTAAQAAAAAATAGGHPAKTHSYTVKSGDTLTSIAASQLGAASRWTEIAQLNGLHDPYTITVGQKLRMP